MSTNAEPLWGHKPDPAREWRVPPVTKEYGLPVEADPPGTAPREIAVAFDPVLGRIALPESGSPPVEPSQIRVSFAYGFSGDVGGGPYPRFESVSSIVPSEPDWRVAITGNAALQDGETFFPGLSAAIAEWNTRPPGTSGVIVFTDSLTYEDPLTTIEIKAGSRLVIVAAKWDGTSSRPISPEGVRPHLRGSIAVNGTTDETENPGELFIDGLLVEGAVQSGAGSIGRMAISHCTIWPDSPEQSPSDSSPSREANVALEAGMNDLRVEISRSICRAIDLGSQAAQLEIVESVIIGGEPTAPAIIGPNAQQVDIKTSTLLGAVETSRLNASNSIFTGQINVERQQEGCVRFSFLPHGSRTPRRYRCQPDLALAAALEDKLASDPKAELTRAERDAVLARVVPSFTSEDHGHPGFCQLSRHIPNEIFTGAEDGSEMGAFSILKQAQRAANLRASLGDYLPFGLEAGIFYVT